MDRNTLYAFLLSSFAGLSTLIGSIIIFIKSDKKNTIISLSLSFASAVMLTVSIFDLLPEAYSLLENKVNHFPLIILELIFFNVGIIISTFIEKRISKKEEGLYKTGITSMLAIILHNIPEGIATFMAGCTDIKLGIALAMAITFHNIPEGISVSVPIYYATKSKKKALLYTFISGISELFGAVVTFLFLKSFINNYIMSFLLATIAGIMIHISIFELFRTSLKYGNRKKTMFYFTIGIIFIFFNHIIFH